MANSVPLRHNQVALVGGTNHINDLLAVMEKSPDSAKKSRMIDWVKTSAVPGTPTGTATNTNLNTKGATAGKTAKAGKTAMRGRNTTKSRTTAASQQAAV